MLFLLLLEACLLSMLVVANLQGTNVVEEKGVARGVRVPV
jgi:hypothetical protein